MSRLPDKKPLFSYGPDLGDKILVPILYLLILGVQWFCFFTYLDFSVGIFSQKWSVYLAFFIFVPTTLVLLLYAYRLFQNRVDFFDDCFVAIQGGQSKTFRADKYKYYCCWVQGAGRTQVKAFVLIKEDGNWFTIPWGGANRNNKLVLAWCERHFKTLAPDFGTYKNPIHDEASLDEAIAKILGQK